MKIFITGGTGFVGRSLTMELARRGHEVTVLDRTVKARTEFPPTVSFIETDGAVRGPWQDRAAEHEVFINLAGASIFSRWNEKKKKELCNSRILTTRNLVEAISYSKYENVHLISTSAVGYYSFHNDEELTEESPPGNDFLAVLAQEWEAAANQARSYNAHVAICRIGVVLGRRGGALRKMLPIFRVCLGCPLGNGKQWFPWIHEKDLVNIFFFLIARKDMEGPFNCTAPNPVRNAEMTRAIGETLGVPTLPLRVPGFMMRLILGELGDILLKGQKAIPRRLTKSGFHFSFPTVHEAMKNILEKE
jgi:uncharacterized protein (TIGR01777 family)